MSKVGKELNFELNIKEIIDEIRIQAIKELATGLLSVYRASIVNTARAQAVKDLKRYLQERKGEEDTITEAIVKALETDYKTELDKII